MKMLFLKKTLPVCLLMFGSGLVAQNIELPTDYIRNAQSGNNTIAKNVIGSPYLDEEFKMGTVIIDNKSFDAKIRYNGLQDEFEVLLAGNENYTLLRRPSIMVKVDGASYKIYPYLDERGIKKQVYFKELSSDKILLLKREGVKLVDAEKADNSYMSDKPAKLDPFSKYYIKEKDKSAEEVSLRKKDFINYFNNPKIKDFIKENDLKLKTEEEALKVIKFSNSL